MNDLNLKVNLKGQYGVANILGFNYDNFSIVSFNNLGENTVHIKTSTWKESNYLN